MQFPLESVQNVSSCDWTSIPITTKPWEATEKWTPIPNKVTPGMTNSMEISILNIDKITLI